MSERMFRELKQRQGGIHVISSKRASLRESTKDLLAHTVKFGQDNRQANPCSDKTVQVGYHSLELIPNSTSRYEGIDNRERRCIMLALRCSRNAASRSRHAASRCITLTSRFHHTYITLASRCITPASRYISTQANLCRRRTNRRARGGGGATPPETA